MRTAEAGGGFRGVVPPGRQSNPAGEFLEAATVSEVRA
jgi:hypothetical protein